MREKIQKIVGRYAYDPEGQTEEILALIAEEVKKLHCTYEICEYFRQKVLGLLEGK